jgi:tetratricopeptide (TPR) repeat protein
VQFRRALGICERSFGPNHPCAAAALTNLASVQRERHQYDSAESLYRRALTIEEATFGPDQPEVFRILSNLGRLYHLEGRYQDAEAVYARALKIADHYPADPGVVDTIANYAVLLRKMHRKGEARGLEARARALSGKLDSDTLSGFSVDWTDLRPTN